MLRQANCYPNVMAEDSTADTKLKSPAFQFRAYLEEPVSASSLAIFRICFSIATVGLVVEYFRAGWIDVLASKIHFSFIPGLTPLPGIGLHIQLIAVAVFAAMVGIGFHYRLASILLFLSYSWIFLCEKALYQNHEYLICLLSLLFSVVGANHAYSIDARRGNINHVVPRWNVEIFKFQFVIVYFFGGIAKLSSDWLQGYPQTGWILQRAADPVFGPILGTLLKQHWFADLVTYGGIAIDLTVGFLLWWQPTFWLGALIACVFHLLNFCLFNIDIFPFLMIASIGLFGHEDWPDKFIARLMHQKNEINSNAIPRRTAPAVVAFICLYIVIQLFFPLRRVLYPGDTSWTEQGQRFAWRMMLRDKQCKAFRMVFQNPSNGMQGVIYPELSMTKRQLDDLCVIPDMILQYSHLIANEFEKEMGFRPVIHVKSMVSLNGRPAQNLVDRSVDLAATPTTILPATWIEPLVKRKLQTEQKSPVDSQ